MKILFAQGNPGSQYSRTRHNVGFITLDVFADAHHAPAWKKHPKAQAETTEVTIEGEKLLLVKPLSFYNDTGMVAQALLHFYKLDPAADLLVIHDDLAIPFGTIRIRQKGSDAGNNGIKSLNQHLGDAYARLRVGIWNELRDKMDDADFVLSAFTASEQEKLAQSLIPHLIERIEDFAHGRLETTSLRHAS